MSNRLPFYQRHSDTSFEAATRIAPKAGTLRGKVFDFISGSGALGATDEEIELALGMEGNTVRPRRRELQLAGHVLDSGARRLTKRNRRAAVWVKATQAEAA